MIINVVQTLTTGMESYGRLIFEGLAPGCSTLFTTIFGCWLVWQLVYKGLVKGDLNPQEFIKYLLICSLIHAFLQASTYFEWIYEPIKDVTSKLIQLIITTLVKDIKPQESTIIGVLQAQYDALDHVFNALNEMMKDSGFMNYINQAASFILRFPFTFIFMQMVCYIFKYIFSLMCVTALSPVLIIAAGFNSTRPMAINALKLLAHSTLTVALSVVAMGATIYALKETASLVPLDASGAFNDRFVGFAFSKEYWFCFIIACVAIYLQMLCAIIANISGFSDGPGPAAFVAGFAATSMAVGKALTLRAGGYVGKKAIGKIRELRSSGGLDLGSGGNKALESAKQETPVD